MWRAKLATNKPHSHHLKLGQAAAAGEFSLSRLETRWLARLTAQAEELPESEDVLIADMVGKVDRSKVRLEEYGL